MIPFRQFQKLLSLLIQANILTMKGKKTFLHPCIKLMEKPHFVFPVVLPVLSTI